MADDPRALRQRRHVPGRAVAGGARGAGDRHEPPRRALEFGRGRRGSAALRHREEFQDQAGRLGPLRRDARVPDQCRGAADQDRAGREARRGRAAAGTQGERDDRAPALRASRRRPDFPAPAPRHLLHRGSRAADLRLEAGQSAGAGVGQAGGRARRRHGGGRRRQGLRGPHHHFRLRRRHRGEPAVLDQVRRHAVGTGARRNPSDAARERTAPPGAAADRRRPEDRARRHQGGDHRRGELRLRHRARWWRSAASTCASAT